MRQKFLDHIDGVLKFLDHIDSVLTPHQFVVIRHLLNARVDLRLEQKYTFRIHPKFHPPPNFRRWLLHCQFEDMLRRLYSHQRRAPFSHACQRRPGAHEVPTLVHCLYQKCT